jgi:uncharacterized membrane protein YgdD (TMEM256/DUF423 family)
MTVVARRLLIAGALLVALATMVGAFGAHALKPHLAIDRYAVLQTAVHYQFFHALGLLAIGLIAERRPGRLVHVAGALVLVGVLLFSGSLYAILAGAPSMVGVVTPVGGLCLIAGWLSTAYAIVRTGVAATSAVGER